MTARYEHERYRITVVPAVCQDAMYLVCMRDQWNDPSGGIVMYDGNSEYLGDDGQWHTVNPYELMSDFVPVVSGMDIVRHGAIECAAEFGRWMLTHGVPENAVLNWIDTNESLFRWVAP